MAVFAGQKRSFSTGKSFQLKMNKEQISFIKREGGLEIPKSLDEDYATLAQFLDNQKLWRNCLNEHRKTYELALLFDFQENTVFSFNPHNWQAKEEFSTQDSLPEKITGVLLVCSSWEPKEEEALKKVSLFLSEDTPVFIFEEFSQKGGLTKEELKREASKRKRVLQNLGLAETKILTRPSPKKNDDINNSLVWRARMPKSWHPREPVNILDEGPYWRRRWIKSLLKENKREYWQAGYQVIDDSAIRDSLQKTTFPANTLSQLRLGFGYHLEALCGCQWQITPNGDWFRTFQCEVDCDG